MHKPQKATGWALWKKILWPEKNFYFVTFIYAIGTSLLSLAIPISVQSLVNTVTFAVLKQPLIIVSILLLSLLIFSGILRGLQDLTVEYFQRHFYARITANIANKILCSTHNSIHALSKGDLVNRYFEIMSVQKQSTKLLIDGITLILQTLTGMFLLAFYHPYFLAFDLILLGLLYLMWNLYGHDAIASSIKESKAKYKTGAWLEQLIFNRHLFYGQKSHQAAIASTDHHINRYLDERGKHFSYLFKQIIFSLSIYAFMSALILGLGGFLVIEGQLTLGQLVAAEIVVALILTGIAKSGGYLESFYDLYAGLDKLEDFEMLAQEEDETEHFLSSKSVDSLEFADIIFNKTLYKDKGYTHYLDQKFEQGKCYHLITDSDLTQRVFLNLLHGHIWPKTGDMSWGNTPFEDIPPRILREEIAVVDAPRVIDGTILENLTWSMDRVSDSQINHALDITLLSEKVDSFEEGVDTLIWHGCDRFSWGELVQLEFARIFLHKPKWVVISSLFNQLRPELQKVVLKELKEQKIGVIVIGFTYNEYHQGQELHDIFDAHVSYTQEWGGDGHA